MKKNKIKPLTQYKGFSTLKSLDAANERLLILKKIMRVQNNNELLLIAKTKPKLILGNLNKLYKKIGPRSIGINPTPICNRHCTFCSSSQRNKINIEDGIEIDREVLDKLLEDFSIMGGRGCVLVGGGEPLLSCGGKINEVILAHHLYYGSNTNGVNLNKFLNPLIIKKFSWISISIIAHNKSLYNKVGGLSVNDNQFNILHKNLRQCSNLIKILQKKNKRFPYLSAKIMICRENYRSAGEIYNYIKKLGFKDIALRCVNNFEIEKSYRGRMLKPQDVELSSEQKKELGRILAHQTDLPKGTIDNIVNGQGNSRDFSIVPSICWNIILGLIVNIDTDGEVYLCNPRLGMKEFSIGNIHYRRLKEIWQSKKHQKVVEKTYLNFKKICDLPKCRHYRVNQTIEAFLNNDVSLKDRDYYDKQMSCFP